MRLPLSVPVSPRAALEYFAHFSLIPWGFLDLIKTEPSHISLYLHVTKQPAEIFRFPPLKKGGGGGI
jgi:hypothetical protein